MTQQQEEADWERCQSARAAECRGPVNLRVGLSELVEWSQNTAHSVVEATLRDCAVSQSCGQVIGEEASEGATQALTPVAKKMRCQKGETGNGKEPETGG